MNQAPKTVNATYCASLIDQLVADGVTHAFIAPGSRSTPLALACLAHDGLATSLFHDERSAAFAALGHGLATGVPGLVLCSSGTAGAHFFAAVIEADAAAVPLIVCTADRPPELWGRGAPQTIDQTELFGNRVRCFVQPGPPDEIDEAGWRPIARQLVAAATGRTPGPVHANMSFRDPLTGVPGALPPALPAIAVEVWPAPDAGVVSSIATQLRGRRGVVIAGRSETDAAHVLNLAALLKWPVIADHRSGCRSPGSASSIRYFDSLLRDSDFATAHLPEVIVRVGEIVSSKATSQWISAARANGATVVATQPHGRIIDPEAVATVNVAESGLIKALVTAVGVDAACDDEWCSSWTDADRQAHHAIDAAVGSVDSEITLAQQALAAVPPGGALVVSSSMPVRDLEWFGQHRDDVSVYSNRGANGIDGVVATAIGIALTGVPTLCLIGDVALLHDSSSLIALRDRPVNLTIAVVNNDGGGIFSFLPQHELLDQTDYETLFGTPHGTDLGQLAAAHGIACEPWTGSDLPPDGVRMVVATSDRDTNLVVHDQAHRAVADALRLG